MAIFISLRVVMDRFLTSLPISNERMFVCRTIRRTVLCSAITIVFLALTLPALSARADSAGRPNIVLILADDLGYGDVGAFGSRLISTPNIDRMMRKGVRLTDAYVSAAVCSPSRAGLLTGSYQSRFGYEYNPTANYVRGPDAKLGLPPSQRTIAEVLSDANYATGLIGKWHLGMLDRYHPLNRGFDEFFGILGGGTSYIDSRRNGVHSWPNPTVPKSRSTHRAVTIMDGFNPVEVEDYLTDVFADRAVEFINDHADRPFFLMLAPNAPHTPIQATERYVDRVRHIKDEGARIYAAMVSALDDMVGQVIGTLEHHDLEFNTMVVFLSDNGCINYMPDRICSNEPLSGAKRFHLEGGIRVPMSIKWPREIPGSTTFKHPVISLDLFSTIAAAAGLDSKSSDSVNLLPYLRGERNDPPHEFLFWRSSPNAAVRWGKWKLWKVNLSDTPMNLMGRALLLPEKDYPAESPLGQMTVLYDLSVDVGERENVAESNPDVVKFLTEKLDHWQSNLADPLWTSRRSTLHNLHGKTVQLFF